MLVDYLPSSSLYNNAECFSFLVVSSPGPAVDTKDLFDVFSHILVLFWGQMSALWLSSFTFWFLDPNFWAPQDCKSRGSIQCACRCRFLEEGVRSHMHSVLAMSAGDFAAAFENIGSLAPCLIRHQIPGIQSQQDPSNPLSSLFLVSQIHLFHIIALTQDAKTVSTRYCRLGGLHN